MSDSSGDTTACPVRRVRFTRLGLHFLFVAVFAMAGGAIRGFNLLLLLAGFLLAVLIVQWRCSRRATESLSVSRRLPNEVFANTPFRIHYFIRNRHRWLNVWMIRVDDQLGAEPSLEAKSSSRANARLKHLISAVSPSDAEPFACGVGLAGAKSTTTTICDCQITNRGRYRFDQIRLSTSFPFALLQAHRTQESRESLVVFPSLLTLQRGWQGHITSQLGAGTATARRSGVGEGDFYGLRPWQHGDSQRQIHWRTTARMGELAVKQTEESRRQDVCLLVDGSLAATPVSNHSALETTISLAATLLVQLVRTPENDVSLVTAGQTIESSGQILAAHSVPQAMTMLADLTGSEQTDLCGAIKSAWEISAGRQSLVILSPRSLADATSSPGNHADRDLQAALSTWRRRADVLWIDVSDTARHSWFTHDKTTDVSNQNRQSDAAEASLPD